MCGSYCYFSVVCVDVIVLSVSPKMPIYTSPHLGSHPLCEFVPVDNQQLLEDVTIKKYCAVHCLGITALS